MSVTVDSIRLVLHVVAAVLLVGAAFLALRRMEAGPRMLDRIVTLDVFTSVLVGGVALVGAWTRRSDLIPVLLALALTGFFGAVALARFTQTDRTADRHILTKEEMAAELAERELVEADDDAPALYDPEEIEEENPDHLLVREAARRDEPYESDDRREARRDAAHGQGEGHEAPPSTPVGSVERTKEER